MEDQKALGRYYTNDIEGMKYWHLIIYYNNDHNI